MSQVLRMGTIPDPSTRTCNVDTASCANGIGQSQALLAIVNRFAPFVLITTQRITPGSNFRNKHISFF